MAAENIIGRSQWFRAFLIGDSIRMGSQNLSAGNVCQSLGIPINNLFTLVAAAGRDQMLWPDGAHYIEAGYRLLGHPVARAVGKVLRITAPK